MWKPTPVFASAVSSGFCVITEGDWKQFSCHNSHHTDWTVPHSIGQGPLVVSTAFAGASSPWSGFLTLGVRYKEQKYTKITHWLIYYYELSTVPLKSKTKISIDFLGSKIRNFNVLFMDEICKSKIR